MYFVVKAKETLQAVLEEMENPFKTLKDKEVNTETVINGSITRIETPLDIMTIILQDGRENN